MSFITKISNINPRSIDIETSSPYDLSYHFQLEDKYGNIIEIDENTNVVATSGKPSTQYKTILFGEASIEPLLDSNGNIEYVPLFNPDGSVILYDHDTDSNTAAIIKYSDVPYTREVIKNTLLVDSSYTLKVFKNLELLESHDFIIKELPVIERPRIITFGSRLIALVFPYPVRNLFSTLPIPDSETDLPTANMASSNFYIQYFGEDLNASTNAKPRWKGYLVTNVAEASPLYDAPFSLITSADEKALFIQSNLKSLPVDDNHVFEVNASRLINHLSDNHVIHDFFGRDIPITQNKFSIDTFDVAAKPISVIFESLTKAVITFDKEICNLKKYKQSGLLKINGADSSFNKISRGNNLFTLIAEPTNLADHVYPSENVLVTVKSIVDASGFDTKETNFTVSITDDPPKIITVKQVLDLENPSNPKTLIDVLFNMPLDKASAEIKSNYAITSVIGSDTNIIIESALLKEPNLVRLTVSELQTGKYNLFVSNVENVSHTPIVDTTVPFEIIDLTSPKIIKLFAGVTDAALTNSAVAIFNDKMNTVGDTSFMLSKNYKLLTVAGSNESFSKLPSLATTESFKNNTMLRINFDKGYDLVSKFLIPGFVDLKTINYITNASGNIYPICNNRVEISLMPPIDVATELFASIIDKSTITIKLDSLEIYKMFDPNSINLNDFIFKLNADRIIPISVTIDDSFKILTFTFSEIFRASSTISISTAPTVSQSADIVGRLLASNKEIVNISKSLPSEALSASPVMLDFDKTPQAIDIAVLFSTPIALLEKSDFKVTLANDKVYIHEVAVDKFNKNLVLFCCYSFNGLNPEFDNVTISTTKDSSRLGTLDENGNKISPFILNADSFNMSNLKFAEVNTGTLNGSQFIIKVDKAFKYFPEKLVNFTLTSTEKYTLLELDALGLSPFATTYPTESHGLNIIKVTTTKQLVPGSTPLTVTGQAKLSLSNDRMTLTIEVNSDTPIPIDHSAAGYITFLPYAFDLLADDLSILNIYSSPTTTI